MPSASSLQSFGRLDVGDVIYERRSRLKPEHALGQTLPELLAELKAIAFATKTRAGTNAQLDLTPMNIL